MSENPFLELLKPENLSKIKIDKRLIPIFKVVIYKIGDYFIKNGLMDIKDWKSFFDKYLLSSDTNQFSIRLESIDEYKIKECLAATIVKKEN